MGLSALVPGVPGGATRTRSDNAVWRCPLASTQRPACFQAVLPAMSFETMLSTHTRRDDASPASVSRPWWCARSGTAAIVRSGRAHVSIAFPASDGGLKLFVELPLAALPLHPSLLAASSTAFHTHVVAVLPANISGLSI